MVLSEWKKHFLQVGPQIFEKPRKASKVDQEEKEKAELFEQIGRLKMENGARPPAFMQVLVEKSPYVIIYTMTFSGLK